MEENLAKAPGLVEENLAKAPGLVESVAFRVPAEFKAKVDVEISRRRSTLRYEGTLALAERLGIPVPEEVEAA